RASPALAQDAAGGADPAPARAQDPAARLRADLRAREPARARGRARPRGEALAKPGAARARTPAPPAAPSPLRAVADAGQRVAVGGGVGGCRVGFPAVLFLGDGRGGGWRGGRGGGVRAAPPPRLSAPGAPPDRSRGYVTADSPRSPVRMRTASCTSNTKTLPS